MNRGRTVLLSSGSTEVTTNTGGGGTTNTVAKFTSPFTIGDSSITDDGTTIALTTSATATFLSVANTLTMGTSQAINATTSLTQQINGATVGTWNTDHLFLGNLTNVGVLRLGDSSAPGSYWSLGRENATTGELAITQGGTKAFHLSASVFRADVDNAVALGDGTRGFKQFYAAYTDISGGVTGNATISKMAGSVNFAAAGTTLVVTNTIVTTSTKIFAMISTSGSTGVLGSVVPGSGNFAINMTTAPAAETRVQWMIISAN